MKRIAPLSMITDGRGWGDAFERAPYAAQRAVPDDIASVGGVRSRYNVVIGTDGFPSTSTQRPDCLLPVAPLHRRPESGRRAQNCS